MPFEIVETKAAEKDIADLTSYMAGTLKNPQAAMNFLDEYDKKIRPLRYFPAGYRTTGFRYRGCDIRLFPFGSYILFFIIDEAAGQVVVLRILKGKREWKAILQRDFGLSQM